MVPTSGVTLHLILPHSLRCPADTYFTQVAMHYPHLQYASGQTVAFGHYEDPLPDQMATKLPVDLQNVAYHCSGYRLLHWSPRLSAGSNKLPPDDVTNIIRVAATLSYYVARQVRRNQESSKLLILTPHNDTVDDILDAVGLPPDNLPPSLYEFYLVMIYKQQIKFFPPLSQNSHAQTTKANSTLLILKMLPSVRSTQKSATTLLSIKIWSGGPPLRQLSRLPSTSPRVSLPTAPSPTRSRPSALVV